jgi:prophage antirepressor-like protein
MNALINLKDCKEFMVVTINNKDHQIKLAGTIDDPYFCGQDVCVVLGYVDIRKALQRCVDDKDEKKSLKELNNEARAAAAPTSMLGKYHKILSFNDGRSVYVSEAGLYNLILSSQAPFAKEFRKLVCKVILPSIRKYGSYHIEQQLAIKDEQLNESMEQLAIEKQRADKAELKALRIKKFMNNIKIKELKLEWIYIATTDQYAKERLFKIGSTERLMSRIAPYNTGRPKEDDYYYVWAMKCYNCKDLDQHIQKLLATFKYDKSNDNKSTLSNKQEMYHGIKFTDLVVIVTFIIENYDKSIDFINTFIKNRLDTSMEEEDEIPERLNLRQLTFKIGEHTEVIDLEKEEEVIIREELTILLEALSEKRKNKDEEIVVMRSDIVEHLASKVVLDRTSLWNRVKTVVSWKDGKTNVKHGEVMCKIKYK